MRKHNAGGPATKYRRTNSRGAFVGGPGAVGGSRKCASVFHEYDNSAVVHAGMMHAWGITSLRRITCGLGPRLGMGFVRQQSPMLHQNELPVNDLTEGPYTPDGCADARARERLTQAPRASGNVIDLQRQ